MSFLNSIIQLILNIFKFSRPQNDLQIPNIAEQKEKPQVISEWAISYIKNFRHTHSSLFKPAEIQQQPHLQSLPLLDRNTNKIKNNYNKLDATWQSDVDDIALYSFEGNFFQIKQLMSPYRSSLTKQMDSNSKPKEEQEQETFSFDEIEPIIGLKRIDSGQIKINNTTAEIEINFYQQNQQQQKVQMTNHNAILDARIIIRQNPMQFDFYVEDQNVLQVNISLLQQQMQEQKSKNVNHLHRPYAEFQIKSQNIFGNAGHTSGIKLVDTSAAFPYRFYNVDSYCYQIGITQGVYGSIPLIIAPVQLSQNRQLFIAIYWKNTSKTYFDLNISKTSSELSNFCYLSQNGLMDVHVIFDFSLQGLYSKIQLLLGKMAFPPYFSLGYHHCRYSFRDQADVMQVDANFDKHMIPYDVIYLDIAHTDHFKYFTFNDLLFPQIDTLLQHFKEKGRKMVTIVDPHVKVDAKYSVYREGERLGVFVKEKDGRKNFEGKCWPGRSVWVDFISERGREFWAQLYHYENYKHSIDNLFIWNDMNEPSVFGDVPEGTLPDDCLHFLLSESNNYKANLNEPLQQQQMQLVRKLHHSQVHNIYGHCNSMATYKGLVERDPHQNQRPFLLTRSFFAGSQKYAAVWTGDTRSEWQYLKGSVPQLLALNLCGISFCGTDVGGFEGNPCNELHIRWYQLGALTPFFRAHSSIGSKRREPYLYDEATLHAIRAAILLRYRILPYLYTVFYEHFCSGVPIMKPLWFEAPDQVELYDNEFQYFLGANLMICPVLEAMVIDIDNNDSQLTIQVPEIKNIHWFDYFTFNEIKAPFQYAVMSVEQIPLFLKSGTITPQFAGVNLKHPQQYLQNSKYLQQNNKYELIIALDESDVAAGSLYIDDGESFNYMNHSQYVYKKFVFSQGILSIQDVLLNDGVQQFNDAKQQRLEIERMIIIGCSGAFAQQRKQLGPLFDLEQQNEDSLSLIVTPKNDAPMLIENNQNYTVLIYPIQTYL